MSGKSFPTPSVVPQKIKLSEFYNMGPDFKNDERSNGYPREIETCEKNAFGMSHLSIVERSN